MHHRIYQNLLLAAATLYSSFAFAQPQIGDHWDRVPVSASWVKSNGPIVRSVFESTVRANDATGVFVGVYAGVPVLMTAHHVMPDQDSCTGRDVAFYDFGKSNHLNQVHFTCSKLLGAWPDVDLSVFTLDPSQASNPFFQGRGLKPAFNSSIPQFEMLLTMGHGSEQNPQNLLTVDMGSDCYVAGATDDFRFRDNTTWSMALACNESAGDSGSPIVDRATGALLGVVWGGHTDKDDDIANSGYVKSIVQANSPDIWVQLNYASPMPVVGAMFKYLLQSQPLDPLTASVLKALLQ